MRYYLVSFNFMYTDFGKWFLGGKEKLVEENLVCAREIRIFLSMKYYLVSYNFMYRDFGKWFLGGKEKLVEENFFIDEREC